MDMVLGFVAGMVVYHFFGVKIVEWVKAKINGPAA